MSRINHADRDRNESALRAAMERLLSGDLPPGGKCDLKTLAGLANVTRTGFYAKKHRDGSVRPGTYQHLAEEFERRRTELQTAGEITDPRDAQIERLKEDAAVLKKRATARDQQIEDLSEFKTLAVSRLAAQYDEIERLRQLLAPYGNVRQLPAASRDLSQRAPAESPALVRMLVPSEKDPAAGGEAAQFRRGGPGDQQAGDE